MQPANHFAKTLTALRKQRATAAANAGEIFRDNRERAFYNEQIRCLDALINVATDHNNHFKKVISTWERK